MTKIPHLLREIFLESGQKLWVVDEVTGFFSAIVYEWQTKGRKRQRKHGESTPKQSLYVEYILLQKKHESFTADRSFTTQLKTLFTIQCFLLLCVSVNSRTRYCIGMSNRKVELFHIIATRQLSILCKCTSTSYIKIMSNKLRGQFYEP